MESLTYSINLQSRPGFEVPTIGVGHEKGVAVVYCVERDVGSLPVLSLGMTLTIPLFTKVKAVVIWT